MIAATLLVGASLVSAPAANAAEADRLAGTGLPAIGVGLSGTVTDATGSLVPGATVTAAYVSAFPVDGVFERTTIGSAVTQSSGRYNLRASDARIDLPPTARTVDVEVTVRLGDVERYSIVEMPVRQVLSTTSVRAAAAPEVVDADLTFGSVVAPVPESSIDAVEPEISEQVDESAAMDAPILATATAAAASTSVCPDARPYWDWVRTSDTRTVWVPIQKTKTLSNSKQTYTWNKTSGTKLEVAYDTPSSNYGSGGLTASRVNSSSVGITMAVDYNQTKLLRVQWQYEKLQKVCNDGTVSPYVTKLNVFRWQPKQITGGNLKSTSTVSWKCNRDRSTTFQNSTKIEKTGSVTYTGAFTVANVSLKSNNTNNTSNTLVVTPKSGGVRICGDSDFPATANRTQEVTR
ncbi:carboxypeptidase-like regulatory domain-containing protein [Microbacterium sp. NPDC091382]|uniref:carboxypeptidase-like regulatory domain-containing protein n=1 Tax=Microbacterium sp. NPDC091382 TaxID=3364210 RepID=UPI0038229B20